MRTLLGSLMTALAFTAWAPCTFAQHSQSTNSKACELGVEAINDIVTLRRAGQTREQVKAVLLIVVKSDKDKLRLLDAMLEKVYDESIASLDTLPRRMLDACTGTVSARKVVPPQIIDATLKRLRVDHDKMTGIRWYYHPTSPRSTNSNGLYLYFGRTGTGQFYVMHLVSRYYGSDWLFVKDAWALANGQRVTVPQYSRVPGAEWQRDHADGYVWEEFDSELIRSADIAAVRKLAESRDVTIRFEGRKYIGDRRVSEQQLVAMRDMIQAYEAVTGSEWK